MPLERKDVLVLLPGYNEEKLLREPLRALKARDIALLAIDDGSTDGSYRILQEEGVETIQFRQNQGKGAALRKGFEEALRREFKWVIILDADGQHAPEDLDIFLAKASEGDYDLINGNRFDDAKNMPKLRYWTNRVMSWIIGSMIGQKVLDSQCGYKMLSTRFLRKARLRSNRFEIEDDIILEAGRHHCQMAYVPVRCMYADEVSHIHPVRDTLRFIHFVSTWFWENKVRTRNKQ